MSNTPQIFEAQKVAQYLAAQNEAAHEAFLESRLRELHTALPAIVQKYDPAKRTVDAQPSIMRVFDDGPRPLPLCVDVPVYFPGGGGFTDTYPIAQGDECILLFAERAVDSWWQSGGVQMPSEYRMHDLSDGFAFVGHFSQTPPAWTAGTTARETWFNGAKIFSIDGSGNAVFAGNLTVQGHATVTGEVQGNGKNLSTHLHIAGTLSSPSGAVTGSTGLPS